MNFKYLNFKMGIKKIKKKERRKKKKIKIKIKRYYGCVDIVDLFQFSNIYAVTPEIRKLYTNPDLQEECLSYIAKIGLFLALFLFSLFLFSFFLSSNEFYDQQHRNRRRAIFKSFFTLLYISSRKKSIRIL